LEYSEFIASVNKQLTEFGNEQKTDLVLLRNHLNMVLNDIETKIEKEYVVCNYCDDHVEKTRPTPFLADIGANMCKGCWDMTKKEYADSNGEYIPEFDDYPHFK
jgi:hypothetical protein